MWGQLAALPPQLSGHGAIAAMELASMDRRVFQLHAAATENARSPSVNWHFDRMTKVGDIRLSRK